MKKSTKACDISPKVRKEVMERDDGRCFICGSFEGIQIAHYISRARMGLGIPQNLACMCYLCHGDHDNGRFHKEYQEAFKRHLRAKYDHWDETQLTYKKWR